MAKKSDFNMSAEIRALIESNKEITGPEVYAKLSKKFPGQKINKNSCQVAFANSRKKMGLTRRQRGKGISRKVARPLISSTSSDTVSLQALRSARDLLNHTGGDVALASSLLREIKSLQD